MTARTSIRISAPFLAVMLLLLAFQPRAATAQTPQPDSASSSDGYVQTYVNGTGLWVDYVRTRVNPPAYTCTNPQLWVDHQLVATGPEVCLGANQDATYRWDPDRYYADGTDICTSWAGVTGYPCINVHS